MFSPRICYTPVTPGECVFNNQGQFKLRYSRRLENIALAGFLLLCLTVGLSGSGVALLAVHGWYLTLKTPPYTPPIWAYFPIWTTLYVWAGFAAWDIWRNLDAGFKNHRALSAWGWSMGLKALWTPVFFGLHWLLPAYTVGLALLGTLAVTCIRFWRLNRGAAALMLPFTAWVAFECYLGAGFWSLNH